MTLVDGPDAERAWHKQGSLARDERPSHQEFAKFTHRNALMFYPKAPPNPVYEFGPGPKPAVAHANTRFTGRGGANGEGGAGEDGMSALDAAAGTQAIARLAAAAHGGAREMVDALRGYQLVATPSPCVAGLDASASAGLGLGDAGGANAVEASPLMTWGSVLGTPTRLLEQEYGSSSRLSQPFKVPTLPPRDAKLHAMANDAGARLRARTPGHAGTRAAVPGGCALSKAASTPSVARTPSVAGDGASVASGALHARPSTGGGAKTPKLSEAAARMAKTINQKMGGGAADTDSALRMSYTAAPPSRQGSRAASRLGTCASASARGTPRLTPRPTPTPTGMLKPSPLLRRPGSTAGASSAAAANAAAAERFFAAAGADVGGSGASLTDGLLALPK